MDDQQVTYPQALRSRQKIRRSGGEKIGGELSLIGGKFTSILAQSLRPDRGGLF
ncbi:hypothetical protein [Pseudoblastomonas halimionae]|uniref:Uncharacterized protein n=1 Tax=Alteriqipengyuania halimionae TaxID=1926630 RepID=A0A6I4U588_9SPHN|nr:hypothetical protein [Alteriqipengyuania halimionae]MXP09602.1 hypothetical protein [Alteriqipengyuania halimionae]